MDIKRKFIDKLNSLGFVKTSYTEDEYSDGYISLNIEEVNSIDEMFSAMVYIGSKRKARQISNAKKAYEDTLNY